MLDVMLGYMDNTAVNKGKAMLNVGIAIIPVKWFGL